MTLLIPMHATFCLHACQLTDSLAFRSASCQICSLQYTYAYVYVELQLYIYTEYISMTM